MPEEPKAHQLYKQIAGTEVVYLSAGSTATNGWELIHDSSSYVSFANRSYIDITGWSRQDLTTFVQGVDIQKQGIPVRGANAQGMLNLYEFDFLTTRKLTTTELDPANLKDLPGFLKNTGDLMEVIYGERMEYAINATIGFTYVQVSGDTFGSGNPTAMKKLHWTRLIVANNQLQNLDDIGVFATNLVVQAITAEEKDLVYMERLRRSYTLQDAAP